MPRKYEELWKQLKAAGFASMQAEPETHATIRKQIIKERRRDLGHCILIDHNDARVVVRRRSKGDVLTLTLLIYKNSLQINLEDLI